MYRPAGGCSSWGTSSAQCPAPQGAGHCHTIQSSKRYISIPVGRGRLFDRYAATNSAYSLPCTEIRPDEFMVRNDQPFSKPTHCAVVGMLPAVWRRPQAPPSRDWHGCIGKDAAGRPTCRHGPNGNVLEQGTCSIKAFVDGLGVRVEHALKEQAWLGFAILPNKEVVVIGHEAARQSIWEVSTRRAEQR